MYIENIIDHENSEKLSCVQSGVPPQLFEDPFILKYFDYNKNWCNEQPEHLALVFFYRESLKSSILEKANFFRWLIGEIFRWTNVKPVTKSVGNKLIVILRIHKKQMHLDKVWSNYTLFESEKFMSHIIDVFWLADNGEGEDIYEVALGEIFPLSYETEEEATSEEAMTITYKVDSMMYFERDKGNEIPNTFSDEEKEQIQDFWEQYPIYKGEIRQCFIHQSVKRNAEYQRTHHGKNIFQKPLRRKRRHNRKNNRKTIEI